MTTEEVPDLPAPQGTRPAIRPPDFLLPASEKGAATRRGGGSNVYVSSGGQVYGPATAEQAIAGLLSGYFDQDALFCPEAGNDWRPLAELSAESAEPASSMPDGSRLILPPPVRRSVQPAGVSRPESTSKRRRSTEVSPQARSGRRRRRERSNAPRGRHLVGRLIVIGAVLLAVLITAGLLLLISRV
jgi:hypothetical protein